MLAALATAGVGPLAPNGPLTPVDSPLELALMAVGARPRQFGQAGDEETRSPSVSPTLTSQTIDTVATADQQTFAAMATAPSALTVKAAASQTTRDTTAPTVSLTAPANGATVSGTVTLTATATDNVGVAGVQFLLDGATLGAEDTSLALQRVVEHHHGQQRHPHADRTSPRRRRQHHHLDGGDRHRRQPGYHGTHGEPHRSRQRRDRVGHGDPERHRHRQCRGGRGAVPAGRRLRWAPRTPASPYGVSWNTTTATNGTHTLTARARDAAGNTTTSTTVTVTVDNHRQVRQP